MNAQSKAMHAYSAVSTTVKTPRNIEYDAVARITHRLRSEAGKGIKGFPGLAKALYDNKRLWNIFAVDVADADNRLPPALKAQIFYLAEFTSQHTTKVLARKADVGPLLEINIAILNGLQSGAA
ncbi:MAG: flagellar biosynthesis regulator FlaF [Rhodobacteraceae bacterium]|nr:flagellar biosynthesis regulator FlaF [Paracoccaceae bacterium]